LAGIKFSLSPSKKGCKNTINISPQKIIKNPIISLKEKYGWNGILSKLEFTPIGFLDPVEWRKRRWIAAMAAIINGKRK